MIPLELIRNFETQMRSLRIGSTPMQRAQKLEKSLGVRRLHLKLEGGNPSGTHKDRAALIHAIDARMKGFDTLTAVSCGNYGAALAYVCEKLDLRCVIHIPTDFVAPRRAEIERRGASVVDVAGDYEAAMRKSIERASRDRVYNANPGSANKELGLFANTYIAKEIAQSLGRQPDWVSVPVGNGTCIGGVWQGFRAMGMKPRMLGASNNNSAVHGVASGLKEELKIPDLRITELNEPLAGNFLTDAEEAISAMTDSNGAGVDVTEDEMVAMAETVRREEGLDVLPASASAVHAIATLDSRNHVFVAVITGKGHY